MSGAAGLYAHLPYCRVRCAYCTFVISTDESSSGRYLGALRREIRLLAPEAAGRPFDSVYLGGGTPSALRPRQVRGLLDEVRGAFAIDAGAEVTLEANPEDVTETSRDAWAAAGVTRLSVGVQSLQNRELAAVGRTHDAPRALTALRLLVGRGFSVSADLILGLPGQTRESFERSLDQTVREGVDHISVYLLEKAGRLEEDRRRHPALYLSEEAQADLWLEMAETLGRFGFLHYEVSNWARPGHEARHNLKYWMRAPTLGIGVAAHEYWNARRRANVTALRTYIQSLEEGRRPLASDRLLGPAEEDRERLVLGLRLARGLPAEVVERWIARSEDPSLPEDYRDWLGGGLLARSGDRVHLTERGFLVSNEILCRFV